MYSIRIVRIGDAAIDAMKPEERVAFRNRHVGFVFQFHHLLPEFTAMENVEMPLLIARKSAAERRERAERLLARVGLAERTTHRPGALSGGEQQRVALARALVAYPMLLLADEPTGNLDEATAADLQQLLRDMHREHDLTSIIVTHIRRLRPPATGRCISSHAACLFTRSTRTRGEWSLTRRG